MPSSAGNDARTVSPEAKKNSHNAVAREAAFRRRREQGSETLYLNHCPISATFPPVEGSSFRGALVLLEKGNP